MPGLAQFDLRQHSNSALKRIGLYVSISYRVRSAAIPGMLARFSHCLRKMPAPANQAVAFKSSAKALADDAGGDLLAESRHACEPANTGWTRYPSTCGQSAGFPRLLAAAGFIHLSARRHVRRGVGGYFGCGRRRFPGLSGGFLFRYFLVGGLRCSFRCRCGKRADNSLLERFRKSFRDKQTFPGGSNPHKNIFCA